MSFTAKQVRALTGIPYQTLNTWVKTEFITPSVSDPSGTGNKRLWAFQDIIAIRAAVMLRQGGVSLQALRKVVYYIQGHHGIERPLASARLIVSGNDVVYCRDERTYFSVLRRPGQTVMRLVIELGEMVQELQRQVLRLEAA